MHCTYPRVGAVTFFFFLASPFVSSSFLGDVDFAIPLEDRTSENSSFMDLPQIEHGLLLRRQNTPTQEVTPFYALPCGSGVGCNGMSLPVLYLVGGKITAEFTTLLINI